MIFLLDQQLPSALKLLFADRGFTAVHVKELGLQNAPDAEVWTRAVAEGWTVVTKDRDYEQLLARSPGASVLWLRCGNCSNRQLEAFVSERWATIAAWTGARSSLLVLD